MAENFANEYQTTLNGAIDSSQTSIVVTSDTGSPAAPFRMRVDSEYLLITGKSGTTFTVTRGVEGSTAASHSDGATITHILTAIGLTAGLWGMEPGLKPPSSPHTDNDEFDYPNGTDPTTVGWSWANQTSVTAQIAHGRLYFNGSASSSRGGHGLFKAFPASGSVDVVIRCGGNMRTNYHGIEIGFVYGTLGTNTDYEMIGYRVDASVERMVQQARYTGGVSHGGSGTNRGTNVKIPQNIVYLRLTYDGANVIGRWTDSPIDDTSWYQIASVAKGRPDFYGIALSDENQVPGGNLQVWADFFRVNWSGSDFDPTD